MFKINLSGNEGFFLMSLNFKMVSILKGLTLDNLKFSENWTKRSGNKEDDTVTTFNNEN